MRLGPVWKISILNRTKLKSMVLLSIKMEKTKDAWRLKIYL